MPTNKKKAVSGSSFSSIHPNTVTLLLSVTEDHFYDHNFHCSAAVHVPSKVVIADNKQQHKTSYEPVLWHLVSDSEQFVQSLLQHVMLATIILHKAIQHGLFYTHSFGCLVS